MAARALHAPRAYRPALTLALTTAVLAEVMRVSFPLLYDFAGRIGFTTAGWVIPLIFAVPLLATPLLRLATPTVLTTIGAGGLAISRIVLQVQDKPGLAAALAGTLLGLLGLSAAWRQAGIAVDGTTVGAATPAFFLGLTVDTSIRIGLTTWDAAWQSTPFAWLVGLGLPAVLGVLVVLGLRDRRGTQGGDDLWLAVLPGPVFALQTLFLANPAFIASSGQEDLPLAGAIVLAGLAYAVVAGVVVVSWTPVRRVSVEGRWVWAIAAVGVTATAAVMTGPTGIAGTAALWGVLAGQVCVGALLGRAAARRTVRPGTSSGSTTRTALGAGLSSLALAAVLFPYQISYEIPLGVPQFAFPVAGALVVAAIVWRVPAGPERVVQAGTLGWVAVAAPVVALLVPLWSAVTWSSQAPLPSPDELQVSTYNVHSAVSWDGGLDPEGIARVLERGDVDVAMLQEVARGWPLAGGLDVASWLSRRLGADVAYGGAADNQFGNAVLSMYPIVRQWSGMLDRGEGTMRRGYVGATISLRGEVYEFWSTHLQHQDHTTATRRAQAEKVLRVWRDIGQPERTVIGGDLNSRPGSPDIEPWFDATGLRSAQDEAGGPARNTSPAGHPEHRIDWIFGTADVKFTEAVVPATLASDHLPVLATVAVTPGGGS